MKTKKTLFLICWILGIFLFLSSCDKKKDSYIFAGDSSYCTDMEMYLIEHDENVVSIFIANYETLSYDSLTTFKVPKYAKVNNYLIAYLLDHPDEISTEKETYTNFWFEGIFLKYEKIKINYTIFIQDGEFHQKEKILTDRSGYVWSWIIGFGLIILGLLVYCILHCWWLIRKRETFDDARFFNLFVFGTSAIIIAAIFIESFMENFWLSLLISLLVAVVYFFLTFVLIIINDCFEKIRVHLIYRDTKRLRKKEKNN